MNMKITKEEFKKLYYERSNKELAERFGVTTRTIISYARKLGLRKLKGGSSTGNKPKLKII